MHLSTNFLQTLYKSSNQEYGPSFMTKFGSALYLENLLTNIFAKLNLRGGVSCMPAALLFLKCTSFVGDVRFNVRGEHVPGCLGRG